MRKRTIILCFFLLATLANKSSAAEQPSAAHTARQQANCGQFQQAIESYNDALVASPGDAVCLARRGYAYARLGNFKQAFADFTAAINCDTNCPDAYSRRSRAHSMLGFHQLSRQDAQKALRLITRTPKAPDLLLEHAELLSAVKKNKQANEECKQVLASCSSGKDVSSLITASLAYSSLGQHQDSVDCLNRALKLSPDCYDIYFLRGASYWNLDKFKLASADFRRYLTYNNKNPLVLFGVGNCSYYEGDNARAVVEYDQAIRLAPNFPAALYWRGVAYHYLDNHNKALSDFSSSIELESTTADVYKERAHIYGHHKKEWVKALKDTQRAISLNPKDARAYLIQAKAYDAIGLFSFAVENYNKAVALAPKDPYVYFDRGMWYRDHKQYKQAIADISEAIKYDPKDAIKYCARGSALVSDHQYQRAIADCTNSLSLNDKRTHPHLSRGIAYAKLGDNNLALIDLSEAIRQAPDYGDAYFERSLVYKAMGDETLSLSDLQRAKQLGYGSPEAMK